jgi:hypothetical protein
MDTVLSEEKTNQDLFPSVWEVVEAFSGIYKEK